MWIELLKVKRISYRQRRLEQAGERLDSGSHVLGPCSRESLAPSKIRELALPFLLPALLLLLSLQSTVIRRATCLPSLLVTSPPGAHSRKLLPRSHPRTTHERSRLAITGGGLCWMLYTCS